MYNLIVLILDAAATIYSIERVTVMNYTQKVDRCVAWSTQSLSLISFRKNEHMWYI